MTITWYVVRASGILAFVLLTVSVVLGLAVSGKARSSRWPRFAIEDVHGFAGVLAGIFIVLHGFALLVDSYMPFSLSQLIVPGTSSYRPLAVTLGVLSAELLAALALTNRFRKEIPYRIWRRAHYANFVVWSFALLHGLLGGSDTGTVWAELMYTVSGGAVAGLAVWRMLTPAPPAREIATEISPSS